MSDSKLPSPWLSIIPLVVMIILLFITIRVFGSDALSGGSQIVLLTVSAVASALAMAFCHVRWKQIEDAICQNILGVSTALIILLLIGALAGSWMISGVVPTLIYYGMMILHPSYFLAACCVICAVVSVMTGSSWTTVATIGIALMGIGQAQGFSAGWVAGAIISGAYFGDKISPLSDTTVLASSVTRTPLFTHIQYMLITTVPSLTIALIVFAIAGLMHTSGSDEQIAQFSESLRGTFHISLWLLIVPLITGILIARKTSPIITLFVSAAVGGLFAIFFQPEILDTISGLSSHSAQSTFKGLMITFFGGTQIETGSEQLNELVATRGMAGMMNTIWLIICAMCFGGSMTGSGFLQSITSLFLRFMKRRVGMVASTVVTGLFMNVCTADQYMSIILTGNMFRDIYKQKGYESRLLSRTTEDSVTVTSVLIPWNTCGLTQSTVLGVSTWAYAPYCVFNYVSPLMSIFIAITGFKIKQLVVGTKEAPDVLKPSDASKS